MTIMGYYTLLVGVLLSTTVISVSGKPIREHQQPVEANITQNREQTDLSYDHYLRQVVEVLEGDPAFRLRLESANISEIKSGGIAAHLELVSHTVRTALDELKRREVARLQKLRELEMKGTSGIDLIMNAMYGVRGHGGVNNFEIPSHLDLNNPHSFEMTDLKNLILKTTADLEELDKKKNEEFKEYEMQKEYEKNKHLNELTEDERKKEETRLEQLKKKHADHPKLNHPGSKDQFEEVWDKTDHLEDQDFNPRTFFFKHDLNGDFEWNIEEVDALLQLELDKVYNARNSPEEDDPVEREEEMNRMRQHIFQEMDKNKDFRITLNEFVTYTGNQGDKPQFEKDEGWKTLDEEPVFSEEDYKKFIESHHAGEGGAQPSENLKFESEHRQGEPHQQPQGEPHQRPQEQPHQRPQEQPHQRPQEQPHQRPQEQPHQRPQEQPHQQPPQNEQLRFQQQGQQPQLNQQQGEQPHLPQEGQIDTHKLQSKEIQDKLNQPPRQREEQ